MSDKVSKLEIFGPVVNIHSYNDLDEAIDTANDSNVSFQSSIFSNDITQILNFYKKINASAVFITIILLSELIGCHLQD